MRYDVAEGIIRDLVENVTALVQHRTGFVQLQPHRVQMVGQIPLHPLTGVRGSEIHPREGLVTRDFHASRAGFPSSQQVVPSGRGGSGPASGARWDSRMAGNWQQRRATGS